jgi:acid stress-induced BolA-like protein IbaG/YrbA
MSPEEVQALLENALPDCQIQVATDGGHFNIVAIGDMFEGKRPVQRQQVVYGALNEQISSGVIHAVNMKIFTQTEWENRA